MRKKTDLNQLKILRQHIISLEDYSFNASNVCIVTGAASGIGRVTAIAAAANKLMTVGIDMDGEGGMETQHLAREMGGQMIFIETDYRRDDQLEHAVSEATKMGEIKYLANMATATGNEPGGDKSREKHHRGRPAMFHVSSYLSELAMAQMLKNSDGTGVIGSLALWPEGSAPSLPVSIQKSSPPPSQNNSPGGTEKDGINFFTINVVHGGTSPLPGPGKANGGTGPLGETGEKLYPHLLDIANLFIYGFSCYAGCLVKGDLLLKKTDCRTRYQ